MWLTRICAIALAGSEADREDVIAQVRRYRQMRYNRLNRDLLEVQNNAYRRSGARGSQARKDLIAFEKEVAEATEKYWPHGNVVW